MPTRIIKPTSQESCVNLAVRRGLNFIHQFGNERKTFDSYGSLLIFCFALLSATSRDRRTKQIGKEQAIRLAKRWRLAHRDIPATASADLILEHVIVCYALGRIGQKALDLRKRIAEAVKIRNVGELLGFDPILEPPPGDIPYKCDCGTKNHRGRRTCSKCRRRLEHQSRYLVWMEALVKTYLGEQCGVSYGAHYGDVLKWLPQMKPYPVWRNDSGDLNQELVDALYAVTHLLYTLNDYNTRKLHWGRLRDEFAFLKMNIESCCTKQNTELVGELLDSLKAFGLSPNNRQIKRGTEYLLASQNEDGSWGDPDEEDADVRCHTTWTAIDGLRTWAWKENSKPLRKNHAVS